MFGFFLGGNGVVKTTLAESRRAVAVHRVLSGELVSPSRPATKPLCLEPGQAEVVATPDLGALLESEVKLLVQFSHCWKPDPLSLVEPGDKPGLLSASLEQPAHSWVGKQTHFTMDSYEAGQKSTPDAPHAGQGVLLGLV